MKNRPFMSFDDKYRPSEDDKKLFQRIIAAVQNNPDRFLAAGAALDDEYSTQAIRDRKAVELRTDRQNPKHNKSEETI
jgi:hypothetical protein